MNKKNQGRRNLIVYTLILAMFTVGLPVVVFYSTIEYSQEPTKRLMKDNERLKRQVDDLKREIYRLHDHIAVNEKTIVDLLKSRKYCKCSSRPLTEEELK